MAFMLLPFLGSAQLLGGLAAALGLATLSMFLLFFSGHVRKGWDEGIKTMKKLIGKLLEWVFFTVISAKLNGMLQDGTVFHDDEQPSEFDFDEEQVLEALDRAVKNMKIGEFTEEKEAWGLNTPEKIEAAGKKKEEGNAYFKAGKYDKASKRYKKAMRYLEFDSKFSDEEQQQTKVLKISCNLNNAACMLKLKDYKEAAKLCTKALELDSRNVKALYRRAQANVQLVELDVAEMDIKKAIEIEPDNRVLKMEYKIVKEKVREYKKDAQFYGNIFTKMNKLEQARTGNATAKQDHLWFDPLKLKST